MTKINSNINVNVLKVMYNKLKKYIIIWCGKVVDLIIKINRIINNNKYTMI